MPQEGRLVLAERRGVMAETNSRNFWDEPVGNVFWMTRTARSSLWQGEDTIGTGVQSAAIILQDLATSVYYRQKSMVKPI